MLKNQPGSLIAHPQCLGVCVCVCVCVCVGEQVGSVAAAMCGMGGCASSRTVSQTDPLSEQRIPVCEREKDRRHYCELTISKYVYKQCAKEGKRRRRRRRKEVSEIVPQS